MCRCTYYVHVLYNPEFMFTQWSIRENYIRENLEFYIPHAKINFCKHFKRQIIPSKSSCYTVHTMYGTCTYCVQVHVHTTCMYSTCT